MTDEFENQLRRALRPVDAPEGFTERLMKRLPEKTRPVVVALPTRPSSSVRRPRNYSFPAALAASMVGAVLLGQHMANDRIQQEEAAGRAASLEFLQALRVTSQKLDMAYEHDSPPRLQEPADEEENRS